METINEIINQNNNQYDNNINDFNNLNNNQYDNNQYDNNINDNNINDNNNMNINDNNQNKEFTLLSYEITKNLNNEIKKKNGIYFTPQTIIKQSICFIKNYLKDNNQTINTILEPCCGSCEFIEILNKNFQKQQIIGVENNNYIFQNINLIKFSKKNKNNIQLVNNDFLHYENKNVSKFDLIIGNPPYYVISKTNVNKKYYKYFEGRPNIFILFIIEAMNKLNHNGILCFVLPKNFLNCIYYDQLRNYIYNHFEILNIFDCSQYKYIDTQQDTIIFTIKYNDPLKKNIQNYKLNNQFTLNIQKYKIFNTIENIKRLNILLKDTTNLFTLNCGVKVGTITWNEHKKILTDDKQKTLLIYNGNIKNNGLKIEKFKNIDKKNYVDKEGTNDMVLLINRGYGKGDYCFNYCLINIEQKYLVENHLITIYHKSIFNKDKLKIFFEKIINSFNNNNTKEFIKLYFGNNAINTNELLYIIPIYNYK